MIGRALILVSLLVAGCKSQDATPPGERPTIESLGPPGGCFPARQPDHRGQPSAATLPTTAPTTQADAHGTPGHWCQLCAAAAQRAAEAGRASVAASSEGDLLQDLPPR